MVTDHAFCRELGHLPRAIFRHPDDSNLTLERCLRCGVVLERSRSNGHEAELPASVKDPLWFEYLAPSS